jgi:acetyl esterase/lipase
MASPQLQQAIDAVKTMVSRGSRVGASFEEGRAAYEEIAPAPDPDVNYEPVSANFVKAEWITATGATADRAVMYLHGGGYVTGSLNTHRDLMGRISRAAQARVLGLDYRLAPEHPFPAAVDDALAGYRFLLAQGLPPARIAVAGDSAGGALTLATLVAARDAGLVMPAAAVCLSPWVDLEGTGESMKTRRDVDPFVTPEGLGMVAEAYLAGMNPRTPLAAPLYADLKGLPPLLIQVGDHETLLDDSTRVAERARQAKVQVTLEVWPEMIHVWHFFGSFLPEGQQAIDGIGKFIREHTG